MKQNIFEKIKDLNWTSMDGHLKIQNPQEMHYKQWLELWNLYCGSHNLNIETTTNTWEKLLNPKCSVKGLMALFDNQVVGFIILVEHDCTWEISPVCYIEDLYVSKLFRGKKYDIAKNFLGIIEQSLQEGLWSRVYGITQQDNIIAQSLYKKYAVGIPYFRYVIKKK